MKARIYQRLSKEMKNDEGIDLARYGGVKFLITAASFVLRINIGWTK